MAETGFDRSITRAGFALILLALVTGLAVPAFLNTRMALAAHLGGILNGLLLVAIGATWSRLALSQGQARITRVAALGAAYVNWGTGCLAAAWGTSRLTPLSGAGYSAAAWQESVVQALQVSLAVAIIGAVAMIVYGLRPRSEAGS
jgi:(hydroxyamino)benzene mutase